MFGLGGIVAGIVLILIGGAMVFFIPSSTTYQRGEMTAMGVVIGFVLIILGAILIFV